MPGNFSRDCLRFFDLSDGVPKNEEGIWQLASGSGMEASREYDLSCDERGLKAPDPHEFRLLPREPLEGWGADYWPRRALSTAEVWKILEEKRRSDNLPPVATGGNAADISDGLPYIGYGLDVGGYVTVAVSPYAGRYGLAAYPFTRYCRVHMEVSRLSLRAGQFDAIIFSGSLALVPEADQGRFLARAADALKPGGLILVTDHEDGPGAKQHLDASGLSTYLREAKEVPESWRDRLRLMRSQRIRVPPLVVAKR